MVSLKQAATFWVPIGKKGLFSSNPVCCDADKIGIMLL